MNIFLLHWAIFIFLAGLLLSLPLGAVYYLKDSQLKQFFTNPRKLKAAHLDYIMQSFSLGLVYLLELGTNTLFPIYALLPLAFGTFCNPFIFLLESTPLYKNGFSKLIYRMLKAASPTALFFAWFVLLFKYMPVYIVWLLVAFVLFLLLAFITNKRKTNSITRFQSTNVSNIHLK
ncbi:hypothetical protein ACLM5H_10260 [Fredinandcohnia humi]